MIVRARLLSHRTPFALLCGMNPGSRLAMQSTPAQFDRPKSGSNAEYAHYKCASNFGRDPADPTKFLTHQPNGETLNSYQP